MVRIVSARNIPPLQPMTDRSPASGRLFSRKLRADQPRLSMGKHHDKHRDKHHKHRGPTTADAEVVIKLYDLRREAVMRASRDTLIRWTPKSYADLAAIADFGHEHNAAFRQVSSYFEMAYGLARRGAVDAELLSEWCGEGMLLYAKVHPFLAEFRAAVSPTAFQNAQWVAENTEHGASRFALFQKRFAAPKAEAKAEAEAES